MTKRQRAQAVELLRCAADIAANGDVGAALGTAAFHLDLIIVPGLAEALGKQDGHWVGLLRNGGPVHDHFVFDEKTQRVSDDAWLICGRNYHLCLLEAAMRVEDCEWP